MKGDRSRGGRPDSLQGRVVGIVVSTAHSEGMARWKVFAVHVSCWHGSGFVLGALLVRLVSVQAGCNGQSGRGPVTGQPT